ncbi:MAG TPA: hypothetical protein VJR89_18655, partial [Polyangiales bacterium]|nr:hypothetical protein [Polyangiales bacterium]
MPVVSWRREASLQRVTLFPLLAPALVCYLIADIAASIGQLDLLGWVIGATALGLSLTARSRDSVSAPYGVRALPWLGFSTSLALLRVLSDQPSRLFVSIVEAGALCVVGASVFDQALRVPDRLGSLRFSRVARGMTYGLGAASALVSALALAGARVPLHYASASLWYAGLCVVYALCVRLLRPRLGSSPDALASNAWGTLSLAPAAALAVSIAFPAMRTARPYLPLWAAGSALALYLGHAFMVDPKRRLSASRVTRDSLAATGALVLMAAGVSAAGKVMPREPLPLALWTVGTLLVALGVFFTLRGLARQVLAPFGGRLLRALADVEHSLAGVQTREELARIVLGGLREACGSRSAQPVLYGFE